MALKLSRVLVLDGVDGVCETILKKGGISVTVPAKLSKEELINELAAHDGVIVRSATKVTKDVLEGSRRLKVVGRAGTGVDNIDVEAATRRGVLVMNTPGGNTLSAAEHTCSLICSLSRSIPQACATLKEGAWDRKKFMGNELNGKVLAIVGLGRIGKEVSDRMKSFGMRVIGYDPIVSPEIANSWGIEHMPLERIWPLADYITVHTPLIPQTRYLINANVFKSCKPTVKIVNVARGGIVEERALLDALNAGACGGAALDVFEEEPPKDLTLVKHPKVICTPHLGANTYEAQKRVAVEIAEQFVAMSEGRQLTGVINAPALADAGNPAARPWIELVSALGALASKLTTNIQNTKLGIAVSGGLAGKFSKLFPSALLKGYLASSAFPEANLVNSSTLAKEVGVEVSVSSQLNSEDSSLRLRDSVDVTLQNGPLTFSLTGSTNGRKPTLFSLNGCVFDNGLTLDNNLIFFQTGKPSITIGSIVEKLQNSPLLAVIVSSSQDNEALVVARTSTNLKAVPDVAKVASSFQIQF